MNIPNNWFDDNHPMKDIGWLLYNNQGVIVDDDFMERLLKYLETLPICELAADDSCASYISV